LFHFNNVLLVEFLTASSVILFARKNENLHKLLKEKANELERVAQEEKEARAKKRARSENEKEKEGGAKEVAERHQEDDEEEIFVNGPPHKRQKSDIVSDDI
jgi:hypothetical protein